MLRVVCKLAPAYIAALLMRLVDEDLGLVLPARAVNVEYGVESDAGTTMNCYAATTGPSCPVRDSLRHIMSQLAYRGRLDRLSP